LKGKDLGRFIENFRARFHDFDQEMIEKSPAEIKNLLLAHHCDEAGAGD
jgi:hypothetical protein